MGFDDVQQPFALILGFCQCNFLRQVEVIPAYYAVPDQSIAAFCNLLIGLVSVFQTIWISDRNGAGEPVRQFDFVQLLLNGLAQFELVDVVQDCGSSSNLNTLPLCCAHDTTPIQTQSRPEHVST